MARSRIIKPEFWDDEKLAAISLQARLVFIALWSHSDDYGVVKGHLAWLKSKIFPYEEQMTLDLFTGWIDELVKIRVILPFDHNAERFFFIRTFNTHQTINKPSKQRNPPPPDEILQATVALPDGYGSATVVLPSETETETEVETEVETEREGKNFLPEKFLKLVERYPEEHHDTINSVVAALKSTRKTGNIADSIWVALFESFARYPVNQVIAGMRVYLDKDCAGEDKKEEYLLGIIRNMKQQKKGGGNGSIGKHSGFKEKHYDGTPLEDNWLLSGSAAASAPGNPAETVSGSR